MKNRVLSVFGFITLTATVALVAVAMVAFYVPFLGNDLASATTYVYFTVLSNLFVGLTALIAIPFYLKSISKRRDQIPTTIQVLRLVSVTTVLITMVTSLTYLSGVVEGGLQTLITGNQLFLHIIIPALSVFSFCFIEVQSKIKFKHVFWILIPMALYGTFYALATAKIFDVGIKDWYHFAYDYEGGVATADINVTKVILSAVIFVFGSLLVTILLWGINQLFHKAYFVRKPLPNPDDTITPEGKKVVIIEEHPEETSAVEEPKEEPAPAVAEEVNEPVVEEKAEEEVKEEVKPAPKKKATTTKKAPAKKEEKAEEKKPAKKAPAKKAEEEKPAKKAPAKKTEKVEEKKPAAKKAPKAEEKKPAAKKETSDAVAGEFGKYEGKTRVYHISQSKSVEGQWQVKLAGGDKAIKLFNTQKEAIEFAKGLVRTQGGSIRIHSMKGKMRK